MGVTIQSLTENRVAATTDDIRDWSHGSIKRRIRPGEAKHDWRDTIGTLWDQRIFGCPTAFACACDRFFGAQYVRMVCDRCGVRIGTEKARWLRFGHINLTHPIPHPFFADAQPLEAVPVLPAAYWDQYGRERLSDAYEELVHLVLIECTAEDLTGSYGVIIANIEALLEHLFDHETEKLDTLARGLALTHEIDEAIDKYDAQLADHDWDDLKLAPD